MTNHPVSRGGRGDLAHRGFTLIEMLVVVALIAATAAAALLITGQHDQQDRRETTLARMDEILRAVAGAVGPVWSGETRLSGFVADNGRLPRSLYELTARDALIDATECASGGTTAADKFPCHKPRQAVFDPSPDASDGAESGGDGSPIDDARAVLSKGLRRYLEVRDGGSALRDGWGNRSVDSDEDTANFGWGLVLPDASASIENWTLSSLGSDNAVTATVPSPDEEGVADLSRSLRPEDWSVDIQGWTVRLTNGTGGALTGGTWVGASLLVWESRAGGGTWRRFTTELRDSGLAAGESVELVFPAGGYPGGSFTSTRVPVGEHVLVLVQSASAAAHDGDDAPLLDADASPVLTQVRFFPGAARPGAELVLR